ncbi:MAG: hypothetical protein KTR32_39455, partial [Granulosicoccus sp.]|nr:hypothetical protein [Granulosicoccus sp.]
RYLEKVPTAPDRLSLTQRASLLAEAVRFGPDAALPLVLDALTARENGDLDLAIQLLQEVDDNFRESALHDDALYLLGYFLLMERIDFEQAHIVLRQLQTEYPASSYSDTALYSEAIALEQLGNTQGARAKFLALRDKHTQVSIGFINQYWPKSTVMSRYWFDRANRRLSILDARAESATRLLDRKTLSRGDMLRVTVNVDGVDLVLLLRPSEVTRNVIIKDGDNQGMDHPETRYYSGLVEGDEASWARVALTSHSIEGIVHSYGVRYELESDSLVGTIEYYQPKVRDANASNSGALIQDYVMHPPPASDATLRRVISNTGAKVETSGAVNRVAQLSIVVDSQYDDYYGGNGLARALSFMNIADGIYREDFGLALQVESAVVFTDRDTDPMNLGAVTLEQTLRSFRDYRMMNASDLPDVSLVYLFTGNQNTDQAIGLAWIGAACRLDGFDVGVTTPSLFGDLLLTHELGHSLGAQHDTDTLCNTATNRLMWPRISSLTSQEFTQCSLDTVSDRIATSCHADALDVSLDVQLPNASTIEAIVRNNDAQRTLTDARLIIDRAAVEFESVPPQCIETLETRLECRTGELLPGAALTLGFALAPTDSSSVSLLLGTEPVGAIDIHTANDSVQVDMTQTVSGETEIEIASVDALTPTLDEQPQFDVVPRQSGGSAGAAAWLILLMVVWRLTLLVSTRRQTSR